VSGVPTIRDLIAAEGIPLGVPHGPSVRGAALLVLMACHRRGVEIDGPRLDEIARLLCLGTGDLARVVDFHCAMLSGTRDSGAVTLCRGVNCTLAGAEDLHAKIRCHLAEACAQRPVVEVFCLNHCDRGPSIRVGDRVYCGATDEVAEEVRHWRDRGVERRPEEDEAAAGS
jgi:NADH:ubiquinone oxidoreductase subunit E